MVYLFLVNDFETVEALTVVDLLRRAKIEIVTVSMEDSLSVTSSLGVTIMADTTFSQCEFKEIDGLVLPGGPGTKRYLEHAHLKDLVRKEYAKGTLISAICAAPMVLAKWGINVKSTIYPTMSNEIKDYEKVPVCQMENVITGEALGASIDFSLAIIKELVGKDRAEEVSSGIVY